MKGQDFGTQCAKKNKNLKPLLAEVKYYMVVKKQILLG